MTLHIPYGHFVNIVCYDSQIICYIDCQNKKSCVSTQLFLYESYRMYSIEHHI